VAIGGTALPAVIGRTIGTLGAADAALIDRVNSIDVQLLNDAMTLGDADAAALSGGANLAMIGGEAVQFGRAVPLGNRRWRLSELWRGRRGTEFAIAGHGADDVFVLIDPATLAAVPAEMAVAGLEVRATGIGDGLSGTAATLTLAGLAVMPLAPVHLSSARRSDGGFDIHWIRRSREGWRWRDGIDAPLGEERESYRVTRTGAGLGALSVEVESSSWVYSAAQVATDVAAGAASVTLSIAQSGSRGISRAATMTVALA
jgi:hypothetical protein